MWEFSSYLHFSIPSTIYHTQLCSLQKCAWSRGEAAAKLWHGRRHFVQNLHRSRLFASFFQLSLHYILPGFCRCRRRFSGTTATLPPMLQKQNGTKNDKDSRMAEKFAKYLEWNFLRLLLFIKCTCYSFTPYSLQLSFTHFGNFS